MIVLVVLTSSSSVQGADVDVKWSLTGTQPRRFFDIISIRRLRVDKAWQYVPVAIGLDVLYCCRDTVGIQGINSMEGRRTLNRVIDKSCTVQCSGNYSYAVRSGPLKGRPGVTRYTLYYRYSQQSFELLRHLS
jgi:hypothetical protein